MTGCKQLCFSRPVFPVTVPHMDTDKRKLRMDGRKETRQQVILPASVI